MKSIASLAGLSRYTATSSLTARRHVGVALAIIIIVTCSAQLTAQTSSKVEHSQSRQQNAARAAELGFNIQDWSYVALLTKANNADSIALADNTGALLELELDSLGISLKPTPAEARKGLKDEPDTLDYARTIRSQWGAQIAQQLGTSDDLFAYYIVGDHIGELYLILVSPELIEENTRSHLEELLKRSIIVLASPRVAISDSLRIKLLEIAVDMLLNSPPESTQSLALRLQHWFNAFDAYTWSLAK